MTEIFQANSVKSPLVTVAMPIYNAGKDLRLAVFSIIKQTFEDWEFIIIDDGSTDNSLQSICDINDARIIVMCDGENKGLAARLNEAIDLARGQYFARMDQDDISYPERFERQLNALRSNAELDLVATRAITIDVDNNATGLYPHSFTHDEICARPWLGFYFPHPTWLGRTEWFRKYRYAVPAPLFCEDQELLLRSYTESRFQMLDETLLAYRVRDGVNWRKLIKTRMAVLKMQWRTFIQKRQFHFAIYSFAAFSGRVFLDLFEAVFWKNKLHHIKGDEKILQEWVGVLCYVRREDK